ncbi:MAG: hypothetical protein R3C19_15780 [Planctomycetaceae bacterium]
MKRRHQISGAAIWLIVLVGGGSFLNNQMTAQSSSLSALTTDVGRWVAGRTRRFEASGSDPFIVAVGDAVFLESSPGEYVQAGLVTQIPGWSSNAPVWSTNANVLLYDGPAVDASAGFRLKYYSTPMSLDWVVKMIIPPDRRREIADLLTAEWQIQQREVMAELKPVMQESLRRAVAAVEAELPKILERHRDEFQKLADRYKEEIVRAEILPLVRDEILPIIEEEAQPLVSELARSLWRRVSLWSFTWRYLYDKSPLPERDAVKSEFQRFLDEEASPEIRSRSDEFIKVTETIIARSMKNPKVKQVISDNLRKVAADPELQSIIWSIIRQALLENETLRTELEHYWRSQEARAAVQFASTRLEPTVRKIGDMIFGNRETGITPEFSRILRSQILSKDRHWFVLVPNEASPSAAAVDGVVPIEIATESMLYPLKFAGTEQSPLTPSDSK